MKRADRRKRIDSRPRIATSFGIVFVPDLPPTRLRKDLRRIDRRYKVNRDIIEYRRALDERLCEMYVAGKRIIGMSVADFNMGFNEWKASR
jgi:hypothetical protein